jgi:AcrR family transcriptional regulator
MAVTAMNESGGTVTEVDEAVPLRALKKQRTAHALRASARDCFKRMPFDEAKLTDIARDAEVSATTVYRYFPTKLELLYSVFQEDNLEFVEKARKLHTRNWRSATEAMVAQARMFFQWIDSYHRSVSQALVAGAFVSRSKEQTEYEHLDDLNALSATDLIIALQGRGLIEATLDARLVGNLLFSLTNAEFYVFVGEKGRSVEVSCTALRRHLELVAPIWLP